MLRNLLTVINSNNKKKPYSVNAKQIGVTRNAVAINPLTGYNVSTGNVMTQVANSSVSNIVTNADFSSGTTGWTKYYSNNTVSNNVLTNTGDGTGDFGDLEQVIATTVNPSKKYYVRCKARVTNSSCAALEVWINGSTGGSYRIINLLNPTQNQLYTLSAVGSFASNATGNIQIWIVHRYVNSATANGKVMEVQQVQLIDLSATFGDNAIPTQAWCDSNIPFFTNTLSNPPWVNPLVTHNQYGYVGGDTTELTFDFGTKVAGSVVECPIRVFRGIVADIATVTPTYMVAQTELTQTQANIDSVKTQDGNLFVQSHANLNNYDWIGFELDLTSVANQLFGGSNSALKSALKNINVDVWAMGSGSNASVLTNGCNIKAYHETDGWLALSTYSGGSIAKVTSIVDVAGSPTYRQKYVQNTNKLYILIHATYASDGSIASSVSLDYAKITIGLNRTVDTVTPKSVVLPKYWAMLVKGFSPSWIDKPNLDGRIFKFSDINGNYYECVFSSSGSIWLTQYLDSVKSETSKSFGSLNKFQITNLLMVKANNMFNLYWLKNNGTMDKVTVSNSTIKNGLFSLYPLTSSAGSYINSFAESFQLYDLQALGRSSSKNLFKGNFETGTVSYGTIGAVYSHGDSTTRLTLPVNSLIRVSPNTTYILTVPSGFNGVMQEFDIDQKCNQSGDAGWGTTGVNRVLTTSSTTYYLNMYMRKGDNSTIVPADLNGTVQLEQNTSGVATTYEPYSRANGFTDYEAESILRGDNKYYVTTTSDYTSKISGSVVENPNIGKYYGGSSLLNPSSFTSEFITGYSLLNTLNGTTCATQYSINTYIPQQLFSFNLIEIVERKYGTIPNCTTVADKVAWLKAGNVKTLIANWYGYGSMPTGNKAYFCGLYNSSWGSADTHTNSTVTKLSRDVSGSLSGYIQSDGFVHFLAYTDASNGTVASTIYTDYISLDVTVKTGNTSVYVPNKELFDINAVTLHSNATRSNGVITLNATAGYQYSNLEIPVLPNNKYQATMTSSDTTNGIIVIAQFYNNIVTSTNTVVFGSGFDGTFTTGSNVNKIRVQISTKIAETITFSNISVKLKM